MSCGSRSKTLIGVQRRADAPFRERNTMSRDDNVKVEGTVVKVHSGGMYQVETDDGRSIRTKLSGRMSRFRIKVLLGDRVTVALSPYDLTHGLIVYRGK